MKTTAIITSKGQITIPRLVRRTLGLKTGDALEFEVHPGKAEMRPAKSGQSSAGVLRPHLPRRWKAPTIAAMDESIARNLARKHRRK
jgi:AbrB family looped-hinge helix DNA binding protein